MLNEYMHIENNFALANISDASARLAMPLLCKWSVYHLLQGRKNIQDNFSQVLQHEIALQGASFTFPSVPYKCVTFLRGTIRLMSSNRGKVIRKGTAPGVCSTRSAGECPALLTKPAFKPFPAFPPCTGNCNYTGKGCFVPLIHQFILRALSTGSF